MTTRTALITGAATGIGKALMEKLDREGWQCFAGYNRQPPDEVLAACSDKTRAVRCNVTDISSVSSAIAEIEAIIGNGSLDLLVNNAAIIGDAGGGVENIDIDRFKLLFEVNFWGPIRVTQAALPLIRRSAQGRIINVGSASQYLTIPMACSYPVTKAALQRVTQALRAEMKPFGIEVACLEPGGVKTDMLDITEEQEAELWASFPEDLLPEYKTHFKFPGDAIESTFPLWTSEKFADRVYRDVIRAKKLKSNYVIGPGVWMLPLIKRTMPDAAQERILERMFRR